MRIFRRILITIAIITAPFVVFFALFIGIHSLLHDGYGPDDGANIAAAMVAGLAAAITAICGWSVALIYAFTSIFDRKKVNFDPPS